MGVDDGQFALVGAEDQVLLFVVGEVLAGGYFWDLLVLLSLYEHVVVLQFLLFGEGPEVDLVASDSCKAQEFAVSCFLCECDVVEFVEGVAGVLEFALVEVPDADRALSEVADGDDVLAVVAEFYCLDASRVELEFAFDGEVAADDVDVGGVVVLALFDRGGG